MSTTTYLNKHFRFVFSPKLINLGYLPEWYVEKRSINRFLVGAGTLSYYLGSVNAETVKKCALNQKSDKHTLKFRKYGKIDIYVK